MFFRKRREAQQKKTFDLARQDLTKWQETLADIGQLLDAGEKFFRLQKLSDNVDMTLGYPNVRDAAEAVTPGKHPSPLKWEIGGATSIGLGILLLGGGPFTASIGGTMIIYGALGCSAGGVYAVQNKRNGRAFEQNEALIAELHGLRKAIHQETLAVQDDMEAHPEKIAQSSRCDELLKISSLHDAFTNAAKSRLNGDTTPKPPGPSSGFHL
jgi:hypothetical protein